MFGDHVNTNTDIPQRRIPWRRLSQVSAVGFVVEASRTSPLRRGGEWNTRPDTIKLIESAHEPTHSDRADARSAENANAADQSGTCYISTNDPDGIVADVRRKLSGPAHYSTEFQPLSQAS